MNLESIHLNKLAKAEPADQTTLLLLGTRLSELRHAANCISISIELLGFGLISLSNLVLNANQRSAVPILGSGIKSGSKITNKRHI